MSQKTYSLETRLCHIVKRRDDDGKGKVTLVSLGKWVCNGDQNISNITFIWGRNSFFQKIMNSFSCQAPVDINIWWRLFLFYIFDISPKFLSSPSNSQLLLSVWSCAFVQNPKLKTTIENKPLSEFWKLSICIKPGRGCAWTAHCVQLHLVKPGSACV